MKFCYFSSVPWPFLDARPPQWPFPNSAFDPARGCDVIHSQLALFAFAEECGFDWVAIGEDHMSAYSLVPDPCTFVGALCRCTSSVKLAILGLPIPLLNPVRVAEQCALLDLMSGGRLIAGFIRGVPQSYAAYNVEPDESKERFSEAAALIVKAWTSDAPFSWSGRFYQFPTISIWPTPLQRPHPPLVYSANSVESAIAGAKAKAAIGTIHLYSRNALELVSKAIAAYKEQATADGWSTTPDSFLIGLPTCIADSDTEAQCLMNPALNYQFGVLSGTYDAKKRDIARTKPGYGYSPVEENPPTLEERIDRSLVLCGSPSTVVNQLQQLTTSLGVGVVSMQFQVGNLPATVVRRGMQLFHDHVRPAFRRTVKEGV
jgi:alkanesulfonate monooxygenase SsuD/methylene tetrahydromethanopterin reductase-like flavin-dependent oxidoreductase (luciferase family)